MERRRDMPDRLEELLALEREIEREWWWLNGALHAVAELQADGHQPSRFREMQAQAREIDRRRTQIAVRIAAEAGRTR